MSRWQKLSFLTAVVLFLAAATDAAEPPVKQPAKPPATASVRPPKSQFLRLVRGQGNRPLALEAAIVRCVPADNRKAAVTVDLVSAVHVGEKRYYAQLNREFAGYDVVLYELIAREGTKIPKGSDGSNNPLSMIQRGMKDLLELEFQLHEIDYTRPNMVRADMTPEQFAQSMKDRGESVLGMFLRMMGNAMAQQADSSDQPSEAQLLAALFDKNRALALKRVMAEQFEDMEGSLMALDGPEGSTLIGQRNKVALDGLRKQIAAGKRKIAIFYGAGHMTDMQKRLRDDFGLVPAGDPRWLVAWDLKGAAAKPKAKKP